MVESQGGGLGSGYFQRINTVESAEMSEDQRFSVKKMLLYAGVAVTNVLVLAALAAYFDGGRLDLISALSIIADSMGIVLGLLGVWFFFLSESLNRRTALNLERTTATVEDLREQMWEMIQSTFNRFLGQESKEDLAEAERAIESLKEEIRESGEADSERLLQALEALSRRVSSIERRTTDLASYQSRPATSSGWAGVPLGATSLATVKHVLSEERDKFPMTILQLVDLISETFSANRTVSLNLVDRLRKLGWLQLDADGVTVDFGPRFERRFGSEDIDGDSGA